MVFWNSGCEMPVMALVDDHELVRESMAAQLSREGHEIVCSTDSLDDVIERTDLDLVIVDLDLGPAGLVDADSVARIIAAGTPVLVVSALGSPRHVRRLVAPGVCGVVGKNEGIVDLLAAVRAACRGEPATSPLLARAFIDDTASDRPALSDQEVRALQLYACGLKLDSVARRMGVAPSTAKQYIDRVRAKYDRAGLHARTKSELYAAGVADGFIPRESSADADR
ncbi:response regulator transcription factor [Gordonia polyisoprenivorans]|nr:response regulator transcription factor [Gordonia polyisoprenivorans]